MGGTAIAWYLRAKGVNLRPMGLRAGTSKARKATSEPSKQRTSKQADGRDGRKPMRCGARRCRLPLSNKAKS